MVEQFSAAIVGGQSTRVATRQSLPTWFLGAHTLQLRMTQPNQVAARPIVVVVNPGGLAARAIDSAGLRSCVCGRRRAAIVVGSGAGGGEVSGRILEPAVSLDDPSLVRCGGQSLERADADLEACPRANFIGRCGRLRRRERLAGLCR